MRVIFMKLAIGVLCTVLSASAVASTVSFSGSGLVAPTGPPDGSGNLPLAVSGTSYDFGDLTTWHLTSNFDFNLVTFLGAGTFSFSNGTDSLAGTLTADGTSGTGFSLAYVVTSAGGVYAGLQGIGSSTVTLLGNPNNPPTPYTEQGSFTLTPEPGSFVLLCLGLLGIGLVRPRVAARRS